MKIQNLFLAIFAILFLYSCANDGAQTTIGKETTATNIASKPIKISVEIKGLAKGQKVILEKKSPQTSETIDTTNKKSKETHFCTNYKGIIFTEDIYWFC